MNVTNGWWLLALMLATGCGSPQEQKEVEAAPVQVVEESPKELLKQAYQLFKEGDDQKSIALANEVLEIGRESKNDTLIGKALTSLCRNAQRSLDTNRFGGTKRTIGRFIGFFWKPTMDDVPSAYECGDVATDRGYG